MIPVPDFQLERGWSPRGTTSPAGQAYFLYMWRTKKVDAIKRTYLSNFFGNRFDILITTPYCDEYVGFILVEGT